MPDQLQKLQRRIEDQEMYAAKQRLHGSRASVAEGLRKLSIMRNLLLLLVEERGEGSKRPPAPSATSKRRKRTYAPNPALLEKKSKRAVGRDRP